MSSWSCTIWDQKQASNYSTLSFQLLCTFQCHFIIIQFDKQQPPLIYSSLQLLLQLLDRRQLCTCTTVHQSTPHLEIFYSSPTKHHFRYTVLTLWVPPLQPFLSLLPCPILEADFGPDPPPFLSCLFWESNESQTAFRTCFSIISHVPSCRYFSRTWQVIHLKQRLHWPFYRF